MKKLLTKICIGTVALAVFLVVGYPKSGFDTTSQSQNQVKNKKGMIKRNESGHFTRGGNSQKILNNKNKTSQYGVIYIGEPTEGLLD